jgi:hypothetical protein
MKYLNVLLTVIAIFLGIISLRLYHIEVLVGNSIQQSSIAMTANQAMVNSNTKVLGELDALKGKVQEMSDKCSKQ